MTTGHHIQEEKIVDLKNDYNKYEIVFQMTGETDPKAVLSISMGAFDGIQITEKHRICIDNINLEKIDAPDIGEQPAGENLLVNSDFASGNEGWENAVTDPGAAEVSFENAVQYTILLMWEPRTGMYSSNRTESFWNRALTIKLRSRQNLQRRGRSNLPCSAPAIHGTAERT